MDRTARYGRVVTSPITSSSNSARTANRKPVASAPVWGQTPDIEQGRRDPDAPYGAMNMHANRHGDPCKATVASSIKARAPSYSLEPTLAVRIQRSFRKSAHCSTCLMLEILADFVNANKIQVLPDSVLLPADQLLKNAYAGSMLDGK